MGIPAGFLNRLEWLFTNLGERKVATFGARAGGMLSEMHAGDRIVLGAAGGAGLNVAFGDKNKPAWERVQTGALWGAGVGMFTGPVMWYAGMAGEAAFRTARTAARGVPTTTSRIGRYLGNRYNVLRSSKSLYKAFGTVPIMMTAGAVTGGILAPSGQRMKGAALGAAAGLGVKAGYGIYRAYEAMPGIGQAAMIAAGTAGVFTVANALAPPQYGDIAEAPPMYETAGIRGRMNNLNATGDVTLGLNNRRHG